MLKDRAKRWRFAANAKSLRLAVSWLTLVAILASCSPVLADAAEEEALVRALALRAGMAVADVGAGNGTWSVFLAETVGERGRVWSTEVDEDEIERIERRLSDEGLDDENRVRVVLGDQAATGLPEGCCDAVLLRMVYHHFTDPEVMRRDLWQAMRPGALVAIVETDPQRGWRRLEGVPERDGGHGISIEELRREMTSSGFEVAETVDPWPGPSGDPYCVVFRKPE